MVNKDSQNGPTSFAARAYYAIKRGPLDLDWAAQPAEQNRVFDNDNDEVECCRQVQYHQ